jgi:hypothetical protein
MNAQETTAKTETSNPKKAKARKKTAKAKKAATPKRTAKSTKAKLWSTFPHVVGLRTYVGGLRSLCSDNLRPRWRLKVPKKFVDWTIVCLVPKNDV